MPDEVQPERPTGARRVGRRAGWALYGLVFCLFGAVASVQILDAVFDPEPGPDVADCRRGVHNLISAVYRARGAAARNPGGERQSMAAFRQALNPEWQDRTALETACERDKAALSTLKEIDLLRYAEEASVRYEVVDVAKRRRRVRQLERRLGPSPAKD